MEVPESFRPKNIPKDGIKKLLERKAGKNRSDKAFFYNLSFKQLEKLAKLESKIDHLKVNFEYTGLEYQLVYTPDFYGDVLLQLLQKSSVHSSGESLQKLRCLSSKVNDAFLTYHTSDYYTSGPLFNKKIFSFMETTENLMVEFLLEKRHFFMKRLEELFTPEYSKFKNIQIYVEYHNLTKDDLEYIDVIPRKHRLEKSLTYDYY